nr:hypothetical protein [Tanacetum cinerariifolium]
VANGGCVGVVVAARWGCGGWCIRRRLRGCHGGGCGNDSGGGWHGGVVVWQCGDGYGGGVRATRRGRWW